MKFVLRRVIQERPKEAPPGWIVFNAPRPLSGHKFWTGDFICGMYFAAANPQQGIGRILDDNLSSDAKVIEFLSEDDAVELAREHCLQEYGESETATFSRRILLGEFHDSVAWGDIEL